ncbi:MAG TPA: hypothetical protein VH858_06665 [Hyphomicrobiales bacterium]|jgi:hypothetical protein
MTKDKAKLEEVKAILHELQRIRPDLASLDKAAQPQPVRPAPSPAVNGAGRAQPLEEHVAAANPASAPQRPVSTVSAGGTNRGALAVGAGFVVVAGAAAGALFMLNQPPKPIKAPDQVAAISPATAPAPAPGPAASPTTLENPPAADSRLALLQQGQRLMLEGDIKGARQALLQPAESGYPDAAFSLARSYDPNFLQSVTNPNAGPDIEQAELWYRRWHEAAVKAGVVTDSLRLERILQSMH